MKVTVNGQQFDTSEEYNVHLYDDVYVKKENNKVAKSSSDNQIDSIELLDVLNDETVIDSLDDVSDGDNNASKQKNEN